MKLDWSLVRKQGLGHLMNGSRGVKRRVNHAGIRVGALESLEERVLLTTISDGTVASYIEVPPPAPTVYPISGESFGASVTSIGDINGDGVPDLAVGATTADSAVPYVGAIHILLMNADGTVQQETTIGNNIGGGPTLADGGYFGASITALGDLDGDGVVDLAVGSPSHNKGRARAGYASGAVYIIFLNSDGTAKSSKLIEKGTAGIPPLSYFSRFGSSVAAIGDLNGDGINDLAVGGWKTTSTIVGHRSHGTPHGRIDILFLDTDGSVKSSTRITQGRNGGPKIPKVDYTGLSLTNMGDVNGDGVTDLAMGNLGDSQEGNKHGAVYLLFMKSNGKVKSFTRIAGNENGGPVVGENEQFGGSVSGIGDLDGDGISELAVGDASPSPSTGTIETGLALGAIHILFLNADGSVKSSTRFTPELSSEPSRHLGDRFGFSIAPAGDLNGDGITELAVGALGNGNASYLQGALYVLFLNTTES